MEEQRIHEELKIVPLLTKIVRGEELTVLEEKTVEVWLDESSSNRSFFEQLKDKEHVALKLLKFDAAESTTADELQKLHSLIDKNRPTPLWRYWLTAATIIFAVSVSVFLYRYFQSDNVVHNDIETGLAAQDIEPGKDQATLTFESGYSLMVEGKSITSDKDGTTYLNGKALTGVVSQFVTLSTPRKGQYKVTLSDGTKVWLNADSKLKYPTQFGSNERLVELQGEGYFEVVHHASNPFIVVSGGQRVKVLGTKFNINAYTDEPHVLTTLVEGSVQLSSEDGKTSVKLKPSQQGKLTNAGFDVTTVDTESFLAWTTNDFHFDGTPLKEVLRQLERWYDLEIDYSTVPNSKVNGTISREKKLKSVLYALEKITDLQFKVTGRRIEIEHK